LDLLDPKDLKAMLDPLALKDSPDPLDLLDPLVLRGRLVLPVLWETTVLPEIPDLREIRAIPAPLVLLDPKDLKVTLELWVLRETKEMPESPLRRRISSLPSGMSPGHGSTPVWPQQRPQDLMIIRVSGLLEDHPCLHGHVLETSTLSFKDNS